MKTYVWIDGKVRPPKSEAEWLKFMASKQRIVRQEVFGDVAVSTVFLGLDHGWSSRSDQSPVVWETAVFRKDADVEIERCSGSVEQAEAQHRAACEKYGLKPKQPEQDGR